MLKIMLLLGFSVVPLLAQADAVSDSMASYAAKGAVDASASSGESMWTKTIPFTDRKGISHSDRTCSTCHNADITKTGKHKKTGKSIAPMALSVPFVAVDEKSIPRYSSAKKIRKWFKRNCKWTYGRECTAQEKSNILSFLVSK